MLYKRAFFILFLIIMVIGTISSISANDLTGDMINDTSDVLNEVDSGFKFQEIQDNDVVESSDDGTFTSLQNKINNAAEDSTITLENDYYYNANFANKKGIQVTKSLTINGNGHAIDGLSKSGLILIKDAKRVILNNITFRNGVYNNDDEQTVVGIHNVEYIELNACSFTNNEGTIGGAVKIRDVNSSLISDSIFSNNKASNNGGAIHLGAINESTIVGCKFINNEVVDYGGAICLNEIVTSLIVDCSFNNNVVSEGRAGAIFLRDMGNSTFKNCSFTNNNANEDSGGAVASIGADFCSFIGCSFENNEVYGAGGDVNFVSVNYTAFNHCKFKHSVARNYAGGSAYLQEFGYCEFNDCNFSFAFATYSGLIHSEVGNLYLKNINVEDSYSRTFGGVVSSRYSNLTVDGCNFRNYHAMDDAGGAIYSFKGNLDIVNSSFSNGSAKYGGAISSVESNLKVLSSKFIDNQATSYGGAIYHTYDDIYVDGSFFNNSHAFSGSAIQCVMSDSLSFTNNIFLNSTAEFGSSIYLVCCNDNVLESGNHFEDVYHLILFYLGHDEKPVVGVKVLNYVLSNTGNYLNTYDSNFLDRLGIGNNDGIYDDLFTLNLWDSNYPLNSTIFGKYDMEFLSNYNLTKFYTFNGESEYFDKLYFYIMNDAKDSLEEYSKDASLKMINGTFRFSLKDWMFYRAYHLNYDIGTSIYPISLFDSSTSNSQDIPQSYDSRNYGYVTPVEDQGDAGNCWAFAGIATLETCIKKITGLTYDFSENNVKNLMALYSLLGMNLNTNTGGYDSMAMAYLNSWLGPINDTFEPYNSYSTLSTTYHPLMHIQNIYFLPARENSLDNDLYKKAIMDYGAVSVTFNWAGSGLHAVSLVGWDDDYYGYDSLGTYTQGHGYLKIVGVRIGEIMVLVIFPIVMHLQAIAVITVMHTHSFSIKMMITIRIISMTMLE